MFQDASGGNREADCCRVDLGLGDPEAERRGGGRSQGHSQVQDVSHCIHGGAICTVAGVWRGARLNKAA